MTEETEAKKKILAVEDLLQSLSTEMTKLKTASQHYDETQENIQAICQSIDKISLTHQELTGTIKQLVPLIENYSNETKKSQEMIRETCIKTNDAVQKALEDQNIAVESSLSEQTITIQKYLDQNENSIQKTLENQNIAIESSLSTQTIALRQHLDENKGIIEKYLLEATTEIRESVRNHFDDLLKQNLVLSKAMKRLQIAAAVGISIGAIIIVLLLIL